MERLQFFFSDKHAFTEMVTHFRFNSHFGKRNVFSGIAFDRGRWNARSRSATLQQDRFRRRNEKRRAPPFNVCSDLWEHHFSKVLMSLWGKKKTD